MGNGTSKEFLFKLYRFIPASHPLLQTVNLTNLSRHLFCFSKHFARHSFGILNSCVILLLISGIYPATLPPFQTVYNFLFWHHHRLRNDVLNLRDLSRHPFCFSKDFTRFFITIMFLISRIYTDIPSCFLNICKVLISHQHQLSSDVFRLKDLSRHPFLFSKQIARFTFEITISCLKMLLIIRTYPGIPSSFLKSLQGPPLVSPSVALRCC